MNYKRQDALPAGVPSAAGAGPGHRAGRELRELPRVRAGAGFHRPRAQGAGPAPHVSHDRAVGHGEPGAHACAQRAARRGEAGDRPVRRGRLRDGHHDLRQRLQFREPRRRTTRRGSRSWPTTARSKGIALGGYSLLASRGAGTAADNTQGVPARFGVMPCLGATWGSNYLAQLQALHGLRRPRRARARRLLSRRPVREHEPSVPPRP